VVRQYEHAIQVILNNITESITVLWTWKKTFLYQQARETHKTNIRVNSGASLFRSAALWYLSHHLSIDMCWHLDCVIHSLDIVHLNARQRVFWRLFYCGRMETSTSRAESSKQYMKLSSF